MECHPKSCEAHIYMAEVMKEMKLLTVELCKNYQSLENSIVKLTENFNELSRINKRLEDVIATQYKRDAEQDAALQKQRDFINKVIGVLGTITLLVPILTNLIHAYFKL